MDRVSRSAIISSLYYIRTFLNVSQQKPAYLRALINTNIAPKIIQKIDYNFSKIQRILGIMKAGVVIVNAEKEKPGSATMTL